MGDQIVPFEEQGNQMVDDHDDAVDIAVVAVIAIDGDTTKPLNLLRCRYCARIHPFRRCSTASATVRNIIVIVVVSAVRLDVHELPHCRGPNCMCM